MSFEASARTTYTSVRRLVAAALGAGVWSVPEALVETFGRIVFGALSSAGARVATSQDPGAEASQVGLAVGLLIAALRRVSTEHDSLEDAVAAISAPGLIS